MKLEDQVCDLKYAKQLKKLIVKQESWFYYVWETQSRIPKEKTINIETKQQFENEKDEHDYRYLRIYSKKLICSAFTATELMEILPVYIKSEYTERYHNISKLNINKSNNKYCVSYLYTEIYDKKMVNALAKMLIRIIKKGLI